MNAQGRAGYVVLRQVRPDEWRWSARRIGIPGYRREGHVRKRFAMLSAATRRRARCSPSSREASGEPASTTDPGGQR